MNPLRTFIEALPALIPLGFWLYPSNAHAASAMPTQADFERAALFTFAAGVILTIAAFAKFWRRS